jgi:hypothetical protein
MLLESVLVNSPTGGGLHFSLFFDGLSAGTRSICENSTRL